MASLRNLISKEHSEHWRLMNVYEKFEQIIALLLTAVIAAVIVSALFRLIEKVYQLLIVGALDPAEPAMFQTVFGMIMTLLIALEFKHSIIKVVARQESIIQVKTVLLIALLAISRKFIILDVKNTSALQIFALAAAVLALGIVYWLMRERDDRLRAVPRRNPG